MMNYRNKTVKKYVDNIPTENYFLLKISSYTGKLTPEDKVNFDLKCSNLTRKGVYARNVNNNLEKLKIINFPYGGKDLDNYWNWLYTSNLDKKKKEILFVATNNSLIRLLKHGIAPLNKQHFLHMDIKAGNVLRGGNDVSIYTNCRLIDWGLAEKYNPNGDIPYGIMIVIQFNIPFQLYLVLKLKSILDIEKLNKLSLNNDLTGEKSILKVIVYNICKFC